MDEDALPVDWRYRGLGEGVVAEDDGVAMAAGRVAGGAMVAMDVVGCVRRGVGDDGRGVGWWLKRRGRVTGRDADGQTAARARRVEGQPASSVIT